MQSYSSQTAMLDGYARYSIKTRPYPGIVPLSTGTVQGCVYVGINPQALSRLDYFEGDEYVRKPVQAKLGTGHSILADAYIINSTHTYKLDDMPWDEKYFSQVHLSEYLVQVKKRMANYCKTD